MLPSFTTARLTLRQRTLADLPDCQAMDRDPEVTRFIHGPWNEPEAHRRFLEDRIRRAYPPGMGYWSIIAADGFAGWLLLAPLDLHGPAIEIGWRLRRAMWGQGVATEAARPVLKHAIDDLGLAEIVADIDSENVASLRVATKLGMRMQRRVPYTGAYAGRTILRHVASPAARDGDKI